MLTPKLRFKRKDGTSYPDWNKEKWADLGVFVSSGTLSKSDLSDTGTPCILYGELYTKYGEIAHTIYSKTSATTHTFSQADDVILPKSGETPEDISTATCIPYDNISLGGDLIVFRHNEKVIGAYLSYLIANRAKSAIASIAQGKSVVHINEKSLSNIELPYPEIEEQRKIADFLFDVDKVIAQSEAEVQNLEQQKKAAMQIIFSQEVRFKREDGTEYPDWQERAMDSVCLMIRNGYTYTADGDRTKKYKVARIETISLGQINMEKVGSVDEIDEQYKMQKGDILVSHINSIQYLGNSAIYLSDIPLYHGMNLLCIRCNDMIISPLYLIQYMRTSRYFRRISERAKRAVNQCSIPVNEFRQISILVPCLEEQHKIAEFLSAYDEAISYANQELEKWKELKKGLLQQMFV